MKDKVIAIDGPSASGKSTVARLVAAHLGIHYVDSGSLYRAVTWMAVREGGGKVAGVDIAAVVRDMDVSFNDDACAIGFMVNGINPVGELRSDVINENVSVVAADPAVRADVVCRLRSLACFGPLVMEGRDIGTAVFPGAMFKFYLDADPMERARRRREELAGADSGPSTEDVHDSLERRDRIDSTRSRDPLRIADGATVIDSTSLDIAGVVDVIVSHVAGEEGFD